MQDKKKITEGGQTWEQVAQSGGRVSALGAIHNSTERHPEQPALCDPALSRTFGLDDLQSTFLTSVVL